MGSDVVPWAHQLVPWAWQWIRCSSAWVLQAFLMFRSGSVGSSTAPRQLHSDSSGQLWVVVRFRGFNKEFRGLASGSDASVLRFFSLPTCITVVPWAPLCHQAAKLKSCWALAGSDVIPLAQQGVPCTHQLLRCSSAHIFPASLMLRSGSVVSSVTSRQLS